MNAKKSTRLESPGFSTLIASNTTATLAEVKNTQKTLKYPKKKWITVTKPEDFNKLEKQVIESVLHNGCSVKFEKIFRKASVVVHFFKILMTKTPHQGCFLWNFLKYLRTPQDGCF